jgi:hypothetical protein
VPWDLPLCVPLTRNPIQDLHEALRDGSDLVRVIRDEVHLLSSDRDGMRPSPEHVATENDSRKGDLSAWVTRVHDRQLEPVAWVIRELTFQVERLDRVVRAPRQGGSLPVRFAPNLRSIRSRDGCILRMGWLGSRQSHAYTGRMMACTCRSQMISWFELAQIWSPVIQIELANDSQLTICPMQR